MTISVTATEAAVLTGDTDGDGVADPGETLTFTVTIQNTSNAGEVLTGVQFAQMLNGVTLVPGSINVSPLAFNDSFTAVGNTLLVVGTTNTSGQPASVVAGNLFSNDVEYLGDTFTLSTFDSTSVNGGQVTVNADGSFTYISAAGFEGTDTFTYTIADGGGLSSVGTVSIAVGGVAGQVWYVDQSYDGSNGSSIGTSLRPYTSLATLNGAGGAGDPDGANDFIYVEGNHTTEFALEASQSLIGTGSALVVGGFTLAAAGSVNTLTHGTGTGVLLSSNNTLSGFNIVGNNTAGTGIADNNGTVGTLTISNVSITGSGKAVDIDQGGTLAVTLGTLSSTGSTTEGVHLQGVSGTFAASSGTIQTSTGVGFLIGASGGGTASSGGNATVTYGGQLTDAGGAAIEIQDRTGGTVTFSGNITEAAGQGIVIDGSAGTINFGGQIAITSGTSNAITLTNNSAAINFTPTGNGLDIVTTTGNGFRADQGGGTVTLTGSGNTVATTSGRAVEIDNVTIGGSGITFQSVGVSNGTSTTGVFLNNAGSGGFTITGTGTTPASGGTISSIDSGTDGNVEQGIGIYINNTNNISLSNMAFTGDFANFGIRGVNVNNFTLRDSTANSASADNGGFGNSNAADEGVISFDNLTGTALFTGNNLSDGHEDIIVIENSTGTLNLTVNDSAANQAVIGKNGEAVGSATGNDGILVSTSGSASLTMLVTGVVFEGWRGDGIQVVSSGTSTQNITISNNTFHNAHADIVSGGGGAVFLGLGAGTGAGPNVTYSITGNTIRGAEGNAISVSAIGPVGTMNGTILNNTIGNNNNAHDAAQADTGSSAGGSGIFARVEKDIGAGTLSHAVRIENNNIGDIVFGAGIHLVANGASDGSGTARLEATVKNNTIDELGVNAYGGINAQVGGAGAGDDGLMGLNIENNTINMSGATNAAAGIIFDDLAATAQFYFPGYAGPYDDAGLAAFHTGAEGNTINVAGTFASQVLTSPTGTFASNAAFVLPVPIMAGALPFEDWEAAVREAQQQAYQDYLASLQASTGSAGDTGDTGGTTDPTPVPAVVDDGVLSQGELALIIDAAIARWQASGATEEQLAAMRAVEVSVSDLGGLMLGASTLGTIVVDDNAGGWSWFVDATPDDDAEYTGSGTQLTALDANGAAGTRVDLLTVIMHELGHQIGLDDSYDANDTHDLMYGSINAGERRLPAHGEGEGATLPTDGGTQYIGAPISIGTLPAGQSLTIQWQATIDAQTNGLIVNPTNSGTVSWTGPIAGNQPTNSVVTTLDTLTLGNLVFLDADQDGAFGAGDSGFDGVALSLFVDSDNDGTPDGAAIATTTTAGGGLYSFTGLAPGNYIVQVDAANFTSGGVLEGRLPTINGGDPDNNIDNDSNGGAFAGGVVNSGTITLAFGTETTLDGTLQLDINNTLDLGFLAAPPVVAVADATVDGTEDTNVVFNAGNGNAITVSDVDSANLTVTLTVLNGLLTLSQTTGLAFTTGDGTADATMEFSGSKADINAALEGLVYRGNLNYEGTDTLTVEADDGTATANEDVTITLADDGIIHGDVNDNTLTGTAAADFFDVSQGGVDTLDGLGGNDGFYFGAALTAADSVDGGAGDNDQLGLQGNYVAFVLGAGNLVGIETLALLPGNDARFGDTANNSYDYDITTVDANVAAGQRLTVNFNTLRAGEDVIFDGSAETDGAFLTFAGLGADTLTGGAQNDGFYFGNGNRWGAGDSVDGGAGNDQLGLQGSYTIVFGATQIAGIETIALLTGGDTRFGNPAGTGYSYDLTMHDGNVAAGQTMTVNANTLRADQPGVTDETLTFNGAAELDGHFNVYSGAGDDTIIGGAGNDTIYGAAGADTLTGGGGNDVFAYMNAAHSTSAERDQITDFTIGDLINLTAIDADTATGGNQAFAFIGTAAFNNVAGELRFENAGGANWLVQGDVDGDGTSDFEIMVTVSDADPITSTDFML